MPDASPGQNGQRRWLEYLPAVFQQQHKLDLFLMPFETQFALFEEILAQIDRNFAVSFAPPDDFLPWLAQWVAHSFDEAWDEDKRRRFLAQAMDLYRWRGTVRGLKRYLELWLDLPPEDVDIREGRWPGGMQIGVASRIGYVVNGGADKTGHTVAQNPVVDLVSHDYYVVDTVTPIDLPAGIDGQSIPDGERIQLYYDAAFVQRIVLQPDRVLLDYFERNATGEGRTLREFSHRRPPGGAQDPAKPNIQRRDKLIDYRSLTVGPAPSAIEGGTLLVGELELPYRFVVDIRRAFSGEPEAEQFWQKVRDVLDPEKPAHTEYFVRFTPVAGRPGLRLMQIGVRSSIGLDTTIA